MYSEGALHASYGSLAVVPGSARLLHIPCMAICMRGTVHRLIRGGTVAYVPVGKHKKLLRSNSEQLGLSGGT